MKGGMTGVDQYGSFHLVMLVKSQELVACGHGSKYTVGFLCVPQKLVRSQDMGCSYSHMTPKSAV